jgi:hypothetical protein
MLKHYTKKKYGGVEVKLQRVFSLALEGDESSASHTSHFTLCMLDLDGRDKRK